MEELWIIICDGKSNSYLKKLECLYEVGRVCNFTKYERMDSIPDLILKLGHC